MAAKILRCVGFARYRQLDRQTARQTQTDTDRHRQTDIRTDRQTDRWTILSPQPPITLTPAQSLTYVSGEERDLNFSPRDPSPGLQYQGGESGGGFLHYQEPHDSDLDSEPLMMMADDGFFFSGRRMEDDRCPEGGKEIGGWRSGMSSKTLLRSLTRSEALSPPETTTWM